MRTRLALVALILAAGAAPAQASAGTARPCYEDQPCFVWHAMGNGARGVILKGGKRAVVDCSTFAYLVTDGGLSKRNPHLKGDRWAAAHC